MIPQRRAKESPPTRTHPIIFLASFPHHSDPHVQPRPTRLRPLRSVHPRERRRVHRAGRNHTPHRPLHARGNDQPPNLLGGPRERRQIPTRPNRHVVRRGFTLDQCLHQLRHPHRLRASLAAPITRCPTPAHARRQSDDRGTESGFVGSSDVHPPQHSNRVPTPTRPRIPPRNRVRSCPPPPSIPSVASTQHDRAAFPRRHRATLLLTCSGPPTSISISRPS